MITAKSILLVGLGGGIGSILRYLTSVVVAKHFHSLFPLSTFAANFTGCLAIGLLIGVFDKFQLVDSDLRLLLITGFCGGYTTFSAFAAENLTLFQSGNYATAILYIFSSIVLGITAVLLGVAIMK